MDMKDIYFLFLLNNILTTNVQEGRSIYGIKKRKKKGQIYSFNQMGWLTPAAHNGTNVIKPTVCLL